jgi:hypothetical protein
MRAWLRLILVAMSVGGGFAGLTVATLAFQQIKQMPAVALFGMLLFFLLYALTVVAGLLFVHNPRWTTPLALILAIQIPRFSSPFIAYHFMAAFQAYVGFFNGHMTNRLDFGADFGLNLLGRNPWGFSINLIPFILLILLLRTARPELKPSPPPLSPAGNG